MPTSRPDVFLSYSREDQATARRFAEALEVEGFAVWWDQTLHSGEAYDKVTENALREARAVVLLWSRSSVDSRWVRAEATTADRLGTLVPVMIETCNRPIMFELTHTTDLSGWRGDRNDPAWRSYVADVRRVMGGQAAPATASAAGPATAAEEGGKAPALWLPVAAGAILAALLLGGGWLWMQQRVEAEAPGVDAITTTSSGPVTLAVLPFANLSSDPEQEYFSDGLTEEILNELAQVKALRVTGRTSSFSFKGRNEDLRVIGEKLGVGNLLEGSVRRDGDTIRITAQLIDAADGAHLWSRSYDRELRNVFVVQEEVAKDVAQALSVTLDVGDMTRSEGGTINLEAYDLFMRGRHLLLRDEREASLQAARLFRETVALDPSFSRAWLNLVAALESRRLYVSDEADSLSREIGEAREKVRRLDPDAWWTHAMEARELLEKGEWLKSEAAIAASLAANGERQVPLDLALTQIDMLASVGRSREAAELGEQAMARDPLALILARSVQSVLDHAGRSGDAQAEYERTRAQIGRTGPTEYWAMARMLMRDDTDAAAVRDQARVLLEFSNRPHKLLAFLAEHYTDGESALPAVREAFEDPANFSLVPMWAIGMFADRFGDRDLALAALRKAAMGPQGGASILWFPQRTGLRTHPRFRQLAIDMGLPDYWRASGKWPDHCTPAEAGDFSCK